MKGLNRAIKPSKSPNIGLWIFPALLFGGLFLAAGSALAALQAYAGPNPAVNEPVTIFVKADRTFTASLEIKNDKTDQVVYTGSFTAPVFTTGQWASAVVWNPQTPVHHPAGRYSCQINITPKNQTPIQKEVKFAVYQ